MHVVMRSELARGKHSFLRFGFEIADVLRKQAKRHHVKIYSVANAGNHLHLLIQAPSREKLSAFLPGISGRIAQTVMGESKSPMFAALSDRSPNLKKSSNAGDPASFWDQRPFSRLISWGRDFKHVAKYLALNATEVSIKMSRGGVRDMFDEIQDLLRRGLLPKSPGLIAAGFV